MESYLSGCKRQIKIGNVVSSWAEIQKGVPQGSILGNYYNYADDNTLSFHSPNFEELLKVLECEGKILIDWFCFNCMQTNPNKFQAIAVRKRTHESSPSFKFISIDRSQTIGY